MQQLNGATVGACLPYLPAPRDNTRVGRLVRGTLLVSARTSALQIGALLARNDDASMEIYAASDVTGADFAIKIVERQYTIDGEEISEHFMYRIAGLGPSMEAKQRAFMLSNNLAYFPLPLLLDVLHLDGDHVGCVTTRFMCSLMDVWRALGPKDYMLAAINVLWAMQYLHEMGCVHNDLKNGNVCINGLGQIFLIDIGIMSRYNSLAMEDDNTVDYAQWNGNRLSSRDLHRGARTVPRSDLEMMGYQLLEWLGGQLPWKRFGEVETPMQNRAMGELKQSYFGDNLCRTPDYPECVKGVDDLIASMQGFVCPLPIRFFLQYVFMIDYNATAAIIDYTYLRSLIGHCIRIL